MVTVACEVFTPVRAIRPELPNPRGPISGSLFEQLRRPPERTAIASAIRDVERPLADDDLQLALYACYELHYRGFSDVDDEWEWDPALLRLRAVLEGLFERALTEAVGESATAGAERGDGSVSDAVRRIISDDDRPSLSLHMRDHGTLGELREFAVHRSAYQLKEADPHSWALPRLAGEAQAAMAAIQFDEYGSGSAAARHSNLFATTLRELALDDTYGAYLDRLPGTTLATINLISLFGLHRRWRGALLGHLAVFEMTSVVPMGRYADALCRLGVNREAREFYDVHETADAVHEKIAGDMVDGLVGDEPHLAPSVLFGACAVLEIEARFADRLLRCWERGNSSLLPS